MRGTDERVLMTDDVLMKVRQVFRILYTQQQFVRQLHRFFCIGFYNKTVNFGL